MLRTWVENVRKYNLKPPFSNTEFYESYIGKDKSKLSGTLEYAHMKFWFSFNAPRTDLRCLKTILFREDMCYCYL